MIRVRATTILIALFLAAVAVRLVFCWLIFPRHFAATSTVGMEFFFDSYREIARAVLSRGEYALEPGIPALHRPPGYVPLLMAAAPWGEHTARLFQLYHAILGGIAVVITWSLAKAARCSARAALTAASIVAFWPFLIWETKVTVPENLLVVLLPLLAFALMRATSSTSFRWAAIAGGVAAYAALTHALYQVAIPAGAIALLFASRDRAWGRRLSTAAVFLAIAVLPVLAWSWRNATTAGYPGLATGFGLHYWKGVYTHEVLLHHPRDYFHDHEIASTEYVSAQLRALGFDGIEENDERSDPIRNRLLDRTAIRHAMTHPLYTIGKVTAKLPLAWIQQQSFTRAAATAVLIAPLLFAAAVTVSRGLRRLLPLWLLLLACNLAAAAIFVEAMPMRYALPWIPLIAVLGSAALDIARPPERIHHSALQ